MIPIEIYLTIPLLIEMEIIPVITMMMKVMVTTKVNQKLLHSAEGPAAPSAGEATNTPTADNSGEAGASGSSGSETLFNALKSNP